MKKVTMKNRFLSLVLCLCMVLSILPATALNAFAATMTGGEVLYLKPNSNWASADARFAAYFYGDGDAWESMTEVEAGSGLYQVTVPVGSWTNVIFCRMNPSNTTNSWDNKWNQSGDLTYDGTNNLCAIDDGQWDCDSNVTWSVYGDQGAEEPECTHESHSQDGKCNTCGETVEHVYVDGSCTCGAVDTAEPVSVTVYCINSSKWSEVWAYAWTVGGAALTWPGIAMTKTGDSINGYDVYAITFDVAYENVIFNNNNNGSQTDDLAMMDGQYFDVKGATWYESLDDVPVVDLLGTDCFLVGAFSDWSTTANEFKLDAEGSTTGYVSLELEANTTYEFKIVREGAWTSCDTSITGDASDLTFSSSIAANCTITTTAAGTYVFAYNTDTSALSVTYPNGDEPDCTHDSHNQEGKCATCGETVEHTYVDGVCTVCGLEKSDITINMTDSYGDGWNGNGIAVYENNTLVEIVTIDDGESATWTCIRDNTKAYSFCWVGGDFPQECAFEILFGDDVVFTATEGVCAGYTDGNEVYSTCDHSYGEGVVTAPTCAEAGYTTYTCITCGRSNATDQVAALGHSYGEDGICTVCGLDKNKVIIINMTDSYGDGWSDNAIAVFKDGTLVGIATVDVGESAIWTWEREADEEYIFYWMRGEYSDECAFEILFGDEVVFTATGSDCEGYTNGQRVYPVCEQHSLGEDGKCVYCGTVVPFVAVGGVKLYDGDYLDNNGTVSSTQPDGGYAYYDGTTLTFHDYTFTGKGYVVEAFEMEGETVEITALVYTTLDELVVNLEGTNTLTGTGMGYGILASLTDYEFGTLVFNGTGTLNLTSDIGITADYITLNSGIVNINAEAGIDTYNADSFLTVSGGELTVTASGDEYSEGIRIGYVTIDGGKVIVSCDGGLALDVCTLTVNGGYLEVKKGGMEAYDDQNDELITLGENVSITSPEGAEFGAFYDEYDQLMHTIYGADGNIADAFVIEGPDVEQGGDQEPFDVVVYNQYGVADTVTLSNPVAIPGQDYVTTVSSTVGSGIGVWGVYVAEEDCWWGNGIYEFDEETNTLTVFGDYVAEGMQIEVVPFVTLTTHMNGGSAIDDYWEHVFGPDETGTFTEMWAYGSEDYFFGAWNDEMGAINPDPNLVFKREGYTVVGYNTAADGSGTAYALDALHKLTEDVEIYLIWQSNTVECPHAWIDATCTEPKTCELCGETEGEALGHSEPVYTNNGETHSAAYPCCGEVFVENEGHTYVDGLCVCGAIENAKNGIYAEDGGLFYYRNGSRCYAGLIEIDGSIYYVRSNAQLVTGRTYWTTKTNGLKAAANYYFDEAGKLCEKNGLIEENGGLYYYVDGKLNYAGLIEIDGAFYYIRSNGQAVTDRSYWITKTNDLKPAASYEFGADGKMVVQGSFVQEADGIYYYVDGKRNYAGLILLDGKYYYVRSNGQLVTDRSYWITKTNDLQPAGNYTFDANGVMENPPA